MIFDTSEPKNIVFENLSNRIQLNVEEIIGRKPLDELHLKIEENFTGKTVLVTGAAGSIGSELVKLLVQLNCKQLVLIDQAESSLYNLEQELLQNLFSNFEIIVADISKKNRMSAIFKKYNPSVVFHLAAYKHVPLMEKQPFEAVYVNVIGTKILADLAIEYGVEKFLFVSTDKAVNPKSVMGNTKRVAELLLEQQNKKNKTKFVITRFGNVLQSNGSLIPLFQQQLKHNSKLIVTDKNVSRYFILTFEAVNLIINTLFLKDAGVYIFEMGESIRILEIATKIKTKFYNNFNQNIEIGFSNLRLGEKLEEELLFNFETKQDTLNPNIYKITKSLHKKDENLENEINSLCEKINVLSNKEIINALTFISSHFL